MEQYVMGIDVGTGTSKGVIVDEQCRIVRMEQISHIMENPLPGFFEMDAEEIWWGDVCRLSRSLLAESGIAPEKIRQHEAIGSHIPQKAVRAIDTSKSVFVQVVSAR